MRRSLPRLKATCLHLVLRWECGHFILWSAQILSAVISLNFAILSSRLIGWALLSRTSLTANYLILGRKLLLILHQCRTAREHTVRANTCSKGCQQHTRRLNCSCKYSQARWVLTKLSRRSPIIDTWSARVKCKYRNSRTRSAHRTCLPRTRTNNHSSWSIRTWCHRSLAIVWFASLTAFRRRRLATIQQD